MFQKIFLFGIMKELIACVKNQICCVEKVMITCLGSGVEGGVQGVLPTLKSFVLSKTRAKFLKIQARYLKIWTNSLKLRAKMVPNICRKTHEDFFPEVTSKKGLYGLCGKKVFEYLGKNPSHTQKFACTYTYGFRSSKAVCSR